MRQSLQLRPRDVERWWRGAVLGVVLLAASAAGGPVAPATQPAVASTAAATQTAATQPAGAIDPATAPVPYRAPDAAAGRTTRDPRGVLVSVGVTCLIATLVVAGAGAALFALLRRVHK
jgi:hypothetical protein